MCLSNYHSSIYNVIPTSVIICSCRIHHTSYIIHHTSYIIWKSPQCVRELKHMLDGYACESDAVEQVCARVFECLRHPRLALFEMEVCALCVCACMCVYVCMCVCVCVCMCACMCRVCVCVWFQLLLFSIVTTICMILNHLIMITIMIIIITIIIIIIIDIITIINFY